MNSLDFLHHRANLNDLCETILDTKGLAYSQEAATNDRLGNFKRAAKKYGVSPLVVVGIFLDKHLDSIATWIREANLGAPAAYVGGEPIEQRIADARNYLDLLYAVYQEILDSEARPLCCDPSPRLRSPFHFCRKGTTGG